MIKNLTCKKLDNAVNVIDDIYFTWELDGCKKQLSFTLTLKNDKKTLKVYAKESSAQICYFPKVKLAPLTKYFFTLLVVTDNGEFESSGEFVSGLTKGFGSAKWISDGCHPALNSDKVGSPAIYLRKNFNLKTLPKFAVASLVGLGGYVLYINDRRVGDQVLDPAFTDYNKRVLSSAFDVAEFLKVGENVIDVVLGDTWYNQTTRDTWGFFRASWRDNPKLLFRLDYDGKTIYSDNSWEFSYGEITSTAIRAGETVDFNKVRGYQKCYEVFPAGGKITPSTIPPIRECEEFSPVSVAKYQTHTIYDFGKNVAGYIGGKFIGEKNQKVKIVYSDRQNNGVLDNQSNSMYIFNQDLEYQTDTLILSGNGDFFKPNFTYHGFRYVAIYGEVEVKGLKAYFVHTDLKRHGYFQTDCEIVNKLYDMSLNSILSNYHGFPEDCPHREKNGWTGDAHLSSVISAYTFDMQESYRKWLLDIVDNQRPSGQISGIVPSAGWGFNWGSGPAWDFAFFAISSLLYEFYGDEQIINCVYPYLKKYYEYITSFLNDGLLRVGLGDWNYPKKVKFDLCPTELTDSCFVMQMSKILLGLADKFKDNAKRVYQKNYQTVKTAIQKKYSDDKTLTGMATLTYFGIIDKTDDILTYLKQNNYKAHFGILGHKFVLDVLTKAGESQAIYNILTNKEYPSFYSWIENGQTSLCEDFELTNSLNHHMFSCMSEYMIKCFSGLNLSSESIAILSPNLPSQIKEVKCESNGFKISVVKDGKSLKVTFFVPSGKKLYFNGKEYLYGSYTEKV